MFVDEGLIDQLDKGDIYKFDGKKFIPINERVNFDRSIGQLIERDIPEGWELVVSKSGDPYIDTENDWMGSPDDYKKFGKGFYVVIDVWTPIYRRNDYVYVGHAVLRKVEK